MLSRLLSGLFALIVGLVFAQIPYFYQHQVSLLSAQIGLTNDKLAGYERASKVAGMPFDDFVSSLMLHKDGEMHKKGVEALELTNKKEREISALNNLQARNFHMKLPALVKYNAMLSDLDTKGPYKARLPDQQESYLFGLLGFVAGILLYSILLFLALSISRRYQLYKVRRLLSSRGYGY